MEGQSKEVKQLMRLRQSRPSFARMISWEFSKVSEDVQRKKSKKKSKRLSGSMGAEGDTNLVDDLGEMDIADDDDNDDDIVDDSSDPSEYDTAPEDELDQLSDQLGDSISTTDTFRTLQNEPSEGLVEGEANVDDSKLSGDSNVDDDDDGAAKRAGNFNPNERRRRPSKKQKRKKAETSRLVFANEFLCMMNVFDAEGEIEDVFEQMKESGSQVDVNRRVPSLVELCMKATRRRRHTSSQSKPASTPSQMLPYGIKRLLTSLHHDQRMLSKQLSYLQNFILPRISVEKEAEDFTKLHVNGHYKFKIPMRSVWTCYPFPVSTTDTHEEFLRSEKSAAFLYAPTCHYFHNSIDFSNMYYENNQFYQYYISSSPSALSALAVTVDLMLPSTIREPKYIAKDQSEDMAFTKGFTTTLVRVKLALKARYPHLIDQYFDLVIPYVMWARGNVLMATDMFHKLVRKETKTRRKAVFLSEIARMLQQFGDDDGACKFYRMAAEVSITSRKTNDKGSKEVSEQTQILMANVHDTGVLDSQKAHKSFSCWSCAMGMSNSKEATVIAGVESMLSYHGAHVEDWLDRATKKIDEVSTRYPNVLLHRSFIEAFRGSETDSRKFFREYRMRSFQQVGDTVLGYMDVRERNPWKPFVEMIKSQKYLDVKPLEVVWRTQLLPVSLTNERAVEAHINSRELNLHINNSGHLTGDMQMLLPPQRDITLDPYTGSMVVNNCPSFIGEWYSAYREQDYLYCGYSNVDQLLLPTPTLIYTKEGGASVHLLFCGHNAITLNQYYDPRTTTMLLYWTGPTGQVAKFNLLNFIKGHLYKDCEKKIQENKEKLKNYKGNKDIYDYMIKILDESHKNNLCMEYDLLVSTSESRYSQDKRIKKDKRLTKQQTKAKPHMHNHGLNFVLYSSPVVFGKTVMMKFQIKSWRNRNILVFIRTTDKAEFQNVQIMDTKNYDVVIQTHNNDEEFICLFSVGDMCLQLFNEFGTFIESINMTGYTSDDGNGLRICDPCIIGPYLFGINKEKSSIWKHMIGSGEDPEADITLAIVPYWSELGQPGSKNEVKHLNTVGRTITGKLLLLQLSVGFGFMDTNTMDFVGLNLPEGLDLPLSEDKKIIKGKFEEFKILTKKLHESDGSQVCKTVIALNNMVLVLELVRAPNTDKPTVNVLYKVSLPGIAKEACIVGKGVGYLISLTMFPNEQQKGYHEHVFHLTKDGQLQGVLPFLGHGPRSFHCTYLHGNSDEGQGQCTSKAGWYAYMRDGKGGILGVKLSS